jgi:hypothetical protein
MYPSGIGHAPQAIIEAEDCLGTEDDTQSVLTVPGFDLIVQFAFTATAKTTCWRCHDEFSILVGFDLVVGILAGKFPVLLVSNTRGAEARYSCGDGDAIGSATIITFGSKKIGPSGILLSFSDC